LSDKPHCGGWARAICAMRCDLGKEEQAMAAKKSFALTGSTVMLLVGAVALAGATYFGRGNILGDVSWAQCPGRNACCGAG